MTLREKVETVLLHEAEQLPRATFDGEVEKFARAVIRAVLDWAEEQQEGYTDGYEDAHDLIVRLKLEAGP